MQVQFPEDVVERREPVLQEHYDFLNDLAAKGFLICAGPFKDPREGAILLFRAENADQVRDVMKGDPYTDIGLFDNHTVREWDICAGGV